MIAISPASSGPAGSHFEGQVAAHYLLSLLIGAEPRGFPGTRIERVEFQRAAEGHPLDDIVICACDRDGSSAVMEIQVRRSLRFTHSDQRFGSVVAQIARASRQPGFFDGRHALAVAVGRAPLNVQGPYQDVLAWARRIGSADTFMARIERPHSANNAMRNFVDVFKAHLANAGAAHDGETVWRLLSRLQVLHFDFTAEGSVCEAWQRERAAHALDADEAGRANALWRYLVEFAIETAARGGDCNRDTLVQELRNGGFRLANERRYSSARSAVAEDARHALEDIADGVGKVRLTRAEHVAAVRTALDQGRYVEIWGEPGVGKSGLLKCFAEEWSAQSRIIVLSPGRVRAGGWGAMRAALGFEGTAREFLVDLAVAGGAALLIDGLDSFTEDERHTVVDLVREAAKVPGFLVVATVRSGYGGDDNEADWLPASALDQLGRATPVTVGELGANEVEELRTAAPNLAPLLADSHPARAIARNLFRLNRLARKPEGERQFRTEIDMAEDWWRSADGNEGGRRERARLLKALGKQVLASAMLNAEAHPAAAVDDLVGSGTLRDLGSERMAFRHDILQDWAVANLIFDEPELAGGLPLDRPAPARLARGFELAARMSLERSADDADWRFLLDGIDRDGVHSSWRRATLLAVVRSEIGSDLLNSVAGSILADDARLLRELIRSVQAVEVRPLLEYLDQLGASVPETAAGLYLPSNPSWTRLMLWLLHLEDELPEAAVQVTGTFFTASYAGIFHRSEIGCLLAEWFFLRLEGVEAHRTDPLANELRLGFLAVCNNVPGLAGRYLRSLMGCNIHDQAVKTLWTLSSVVAQAAPQELADLTVAMLIPGRAERRSQRPIGSPTSLSDLPSSEWDELGREPFGSSDIAFVPPSPKQGPFLALLDHAPSIGLNLVRRLVDHAILVRNRGQSNGTHAMTISFGDGGRTFSHLQTYVWSRVWGNGDPCVQSAMMALEAWAHRKLDGGEEVDTVLAQLLTTTEVPAAYLLVAVDLVLSHWPRSRKAAIPFLICPELLCLDLQRMSADSTAGRELVQFNALLGVPDESSGSDSLRARASRQVSLEFLLRGYAIDGPPEMRVEMAGVLQQAVDRLGPYEEEADKSDPKFMAVHALNLLSPANWRERSTSDPNGEAINVWEYVSPPDEEEHLDRLRASASASLADRDMQFALLNAVEAPSASSTGFASQAMEWVLRPPPPTADDAWDRAGHRDLGTMAAAVVAMRDGDDTLRARHRVWAREVFVKALTTEGGDRLVPETNIRFNPVAMAFIGIVQLLRGGVEAEDVRTLLEATIRRDVLAVSGFRVVAETIAAIDERLPRALLRAALESCISPRRRWEDPGGNRTADSEQRVRSAMYREMGWLFGKRDEPEWPAFPARSAVRSGGLRISPIFRELPEDIGRQEGDKQTEEYVNLQSAARWLKSAAGLFDGESRPWLRDLAQSYAHWTAVANGSKLNARDRVKGGPRDWNAVYYDLVARCLPGLAPKNVDRLALDPIRSLPDESFFDAAGYFLRSLDYVYFGNHAIAETEAVRIRTSLAERLAECPDWTWSGGDPSPSIELHMGSALAAFFFNNWNRIPPSSCYLLPPSIAMIGPFLSILERLVVQCPGGFVASLVLDLVEVSPEPEHLSFVAVAAEAWLSKHPNDRSFWTDTDNARRLCHVINGIGAQQPVTRWTGSIRTRIGNVVSALVGLGIPEAAQLEQDLAGGHDPAS